MNGWTNPRGVFTHQMSFTYGVLLSFLEEAMRNDHYVVESLELHLFFGRIMKEHALFIRGLLDPY